MTKKTKPVVMVPCATVSKKYFKQLSELRANQHKPLGDMERKRIKYQIVYERELKNSSQKVFKVHFFFEKNDREAIRHVRSVAQCKNKDDGWRILSLSRLIKTKKPF